MAEYMQAIRFYANPQTWHDDAMNLVESANNSKRNAVVKKGAKIGANVLSAATGIVVTVKDTVETIAKTPVVLVTGMPLWAARYFNPDFMEFMPTAASTAESAKRAAKHALGVLSSLGAVLGELVFVGRATEMNIKVQNYMGNTSTSEMNNQISAAKAEVERQRSEIARDQLKRKEEARHGIPQRKEEKRQAKQIRQEKAAIKKAQREEAEAEARKEAEAEARKEAEAEARKEAEAEARKEAEAEARKKAEAEARKKEDEFFARDAALLHI